MPESISIPVVERFISIKKNRDNLSSRLANLQGKLDASRERYNAQMRELGAYGIGSLDELDNKVIDLTKQGNAALDEGEKKMNEIDNELTQVDNL